MDTRNLIALGMLLAVVVAGLMKGSIDGQSVKEIVIFLSGGVVGATVPRRGPGGPAQHIPTTAMVILALGCMWIAAK